MDREARLALESAISDLRDISERLSRLVPGTDGEVRAELLAMQTHSETAIRHYRHVLARLGRPNALTQRVAEAAFGIGAVGLELPRYSRNSNSL